MLLAADGKMATPGSRSTCPHCDGAVIAKCGDEVSWHWAHSRRDCGAWSEPETLWHLLWKRYALEQGWGVEVAIGEHRADIVLPDGRVVELQATHLSPTMIAKREAHYTTHAAGLAWCYRGSRIQHALVWTRRRYDGRYSPLRTGPGFRIVGNRTMGLHGEQTHLHLGRELIHVEMAMVETRQGSVRCVGRALGRRPAPFADGRHAPSDLRLSPRGDVSVRPPL